MLNRLVCVKAGLKSERKVFLQGGSNICIDLCIKTHMSLAMRKPAFCMCENKDADQLRGDREADQCLCFRYTDRTIPHLPKSEISSL